MLNSNEVQRSENQESSRCSSHGQLETWEELKFQFKSEGKKKAPVPVQRHFGKKNYFLFRFRSDFLLYSGFN